MKDKLIFFIIGILSGAIISTGSIYFYTLAVNNNTASSTPGQFQQTPGTPLNGENGGTPPSMPSNTNPSQSN